MVPRAIAVVLLLLGCLPIPALLEGGAANTPTQARSMAQYAARWIDWGLGSAICAAVAVVAVIVWRARARDASGSVRRTAHDGTPPSVLSGMRIRLLTGWGIPAVAFALYAGIARFVFDGRPLDRKSVV